MQGGIHTSTLWTNTLLQVQKECGRLSKTGNTGNFVHSKTGIPKIMIKLLFRNKQIQANKDIDMLPSEANIYLKLDLFGGQDYDICGINNATMYCSDCNHFFCSECCDRVHRHPKRTTHNPSPIDKGNNSTEILSQTSSIATDDDNFCSQANISFHDAMLVATLAEKFGLTSLKTFQKKIIDATLEGRDTLAIHPTGSGKSLCSSFHQFFKKRKLL